MTVSGSRADDEAVARLIHAVSAAINHRLDPTKLASDTECQPLLELRELRRLAQQGSSGQRSADFVRPLFERVISLSGDDDLKAVALIWQSPHSKLDLARLEAGRKMTKPVGSKQVKRRTERSYAPQLARLLLRCEREGLPLGHDPPGGKTLSIGRFELRDIEPIATCAQREPIGTRFQFDFQAVEPRDRPPEWSLLESTVLASLIKEHQRGRRIFQDDLIVDVRNIYLRSSNGKTVYQCDYSPASYYVWAATADVLDRPIKDDLPEADGATLRKHWDRQAARWPDDLKQVPCPVRLGTATVLIAARSNELILLQRSHRVAEASGNDGAGRLPVHCVGEGSRPNDLMDDRFTPEATARRVLEDSGSGHGELLLGERYGLPYELFETAAFFDHQRWQLVFSYLARVDASSPEIEGALRGARHGTLETASIITRAWNPQSDAIVDLLVGRDARYYLSSNHAVAALLYACYFEIGLPTMNRRLGSA